MSKGLLVSPKHGVNPSMELCFWCGEVKGIALLGKLKGDAEAPKEIVLNYEPCDKCKELFEQGILIVEVTTTPMQQDKLPFQHNPNEPPIYPTGRHLVLKPEALAEDARNHDKYMMLTKEFEELLQKVKD